MYARLHVIEDIIFSSSPFPFRVKLFRLFFVALLYYFALIIMRERLLDVAIMQRK